MYFRKLNNTDPPTYPNKRLNGRELHRRLHAIFSDLDAQHHQATVGGLLCDDEDLRASLEQRFVGGLEGNDGHALRHDDFLAAALVAERQFLAIVGGYDCINVGVSHAGAGLEIPVVVAFPGAPQRFREYMHFEGLQSWSWPSRDRCHTDETTLFNVAHLECGQNVDFGIDGDVHLQLFAFTRLHLQLMAVESGNSAPYSYSGLRLCQRICHTKQNRANQQQCFNLVHDQLPEMTL